MKSLLLALAIAAAAVAGGAWLLDRNGGGGPVYRTAPVTRGDLLVTVGATGTLEPEEVIDVGAQVVGRIMEFGADPRAAQDSAYDGRRVDYNTPVEAGTVLARIDPAIYHAQFAQAQAALHRAEADKLQAEARLVLAKAEWERAQRLQRMTVSASPRTTGRAIQAISNSDYILAKADYEVARANVGVTSAAAEQARGALELAQTNLDYTVIKSPVRGTIIDRRVNIGQTVVASLNAPSLFLLAKDLRRMEVWASVNEADIGQLKHGTPVRFTVDAFPEDEFHGAVEQIRLNAAMTQNVVTYTVVVSVDNSDLKLLPYLTADVKFEAARREGVLRVPNGALRYRPVGVAEGEAEPGTSGEEAKTPAKRRRGVVWTPGGPGAPPRGLAVTVGPTDGAFTEVAGEGIVEGLAVIVGEALETATEKVNNPFAPKFPGGKSR